MRTERILYIHSGRCTVYDWSKDRFVEGPTFLEGEAGAADLREHLQQDPDRLTAVLADIVEEEHYHDIVPKLNRIDQRALLKRRISRSYSRTRYRNGAILNVDTGDSNTVSIRLSGITRAEAIRTWTSATDSLCCPIIGVFTPTVLSESILKAVGRDDASATMIATTHSDGRIRHTYFKGGCLIGSRRFRGRTGDRVNQSNFIVQQVESSLRHFNPSTTPGFGAITDVVLIGGDENGELDEDILATAAGCRIRRTSIAAVARSIGMKQVPGANQGEMLFLNMLRKRRGDGDFSPPSERRYGVLKLVKMRTAVAAWAIAFILIGVAGFDTYNALQMRKETSAVNRRAAELSIGRTDIDDPQAAVDPLIMRASVTSYRELLRNTPRPEPLFELVSTAVGEHPGIQIDAISWGPATAPEAGYGPENESIDDSAPAMLMLSIAGSVTPFSGNYEDAFVLVDDFVDTLTHQSGVDDASAVRMPLDVSPQSSLEGEISSRNQAMEATFELQVFVRQSHESA